jgi:DNA-binding response OmpR family regulator
MNSTGSSRPPFRLQRSSSGFSRRSSVCFCVVDAARQPAPKKRLSVLIADDDRDTVLTLAAILHDEGHLVHAFYNGNDVVPAVVRYKPQVCILDLEMPGCSGFALAQKLARPGAHRPVLIAISGKWTRKGEQLLALSVGFDRFFVKPANPEELVEFLGEIGSGGNNAR